MADISNTELSGFEDLIAQQLSHLGPDRGFVEDLRGRLVSSQIFQKRREIGAIVVSSLSVFFLGALAFTIGQFVHKAGKVIKQRE